jgi:predicted DNA-binding protein with PD1-like motif
MDKVWIKEVNFLRSFLIKIAQGEDLVAKLFEAIKEADIDHAVVTSAVGSVSDVRFRGIKTGAKLPITHPRTTIHEMEGPMELLGINGNIFPDGKGELDSHLHIQVSKSSGEVLGGHLFSANVFASCEIMLTEIAADGVERHQSKTGGTPTIFIEGEDD